LKTYENPEIEWALRTGYPSWNQYQLIYCDECGDEIEGTAYEDDRHEYLCESCLLALHEKE
jgi:hypothetical protein